MQIGLRRGRQGRNAFVIFGYRSPTHSTRYWNLAFKSTLAFLPSAAHGRDYQKAPAEAERDMNWTSNRRVTVVPTRAPATVSQQEAFILRPYVDFLMNDDVEGLYNLARHAGIQLGGGSLAGTVLSHYRLGDGRYDIDRASEDFASRPLLPEIT